MRLCPTLCVECTDTKAPAGGLSYPDTFDSEARFQRRLHYLLEGKTVTSLSCSHVARPPTGQVCDGKANEVKTMG